MLDVEVISLICSCWTTYGVTTFTVPTFPSILALTNDFLAVSPNIWGFSAVPLTCWCWRGGRRRWGCQIDQWSCWRWGRRWRWTRQITCHGTWTLACRLGYELLLLGLHCQGRWQLWMCGCMDSGSNLPLFTGFLIKERDSGFYWSMVETKEVYFKNRLPETRGFE